MFNTTMRKTLISAIVAAFALNMAYGISIHAKGGISGSTTPVPAGNIENAVQQVKDAAQQAKDAAETVERTYEQGKDTVSAINQKLEQSGLKTVFTKVWGGLKSFFSDEKARGLLLDTLKLSMKLVANIFTLIADALNRILGAFGGN